MKNKLLIKRIFAIAAIAFGILFGSIWGVNRYCFGDKVFTLLGIPSWSNGTIGTHYPAIVGSIFILIGIGVLNATLPKKARFWIGLIAIVLLVVFNFAVANM